MFRPNTYLARRKKLKEKIGKGLILLFGNGESPMNYTDNTYHFRQDSTFLYYYGIQRPGLTAVLDVDNDHEIIFGNEYSIEDIVWRGRQTSIVEMTDACGVETVKPSQELSSMLDQAKRKGRTIHFLPLYRHENKIRLDELLDIAPREIDTNFSLDLVRAVIGQREIKSHEEIVELEKSVNVSVDMHLAAMKMAKPGLFEAQVTAEIQTGGYSCRRECIVSNHCNYKGPNFT